jgi:SagB-type dehydrogenase family enzyme
VEEDQKRDVGVEAVCRSIRPLPLESSVSGTIVPEPSEFGTLLCKRRSLRAFSSEPIPRKKLERVLVDCAGGVMTSPIGNGTNCNKLYRTIPQGGGICSLSIFVILLRDTGHLSVGGYVLCPHTNALHKLEKGIDAKELAAAMRQAQMPVFGDASAILVIAGDFESKTFKYGKLGYRLVSLEAGCALQNALLSIADQDLAGFAYGGFDDQPLAEMLKLSFPDQTPLSAVVFGVPKSSE